MPNDPIAPRKVSRAGYVWCPSCIDTATTTPGVYVPRSLCKAAEPAEEPMFEDDVTETAGELHCPAGHAVQDAKPAGGGA